MLRFSVKKINGKKYLYARESIFVAKGKTITKNKSLGRVDSSTGKLNQEIEFKKEVKEKEMKERTKYWKNKVQNKTAFPVEVIKNIEKHRGELYRQKQELGPLGKGAMETAFLIDFIYNSNKIEGSKIPRKQIEKIVKEAKVSRNAEVENSVRALEESKNLIKNPSINKIIKLHKILLKHEPSKHGIRQEPVVVNNEETTDFKEITSQLNNLLAWYKEKRHKMYPPELAFTFYYKFERIHPFIDGNGRVGRLLMNAILKEHKYHPIILWNNQRISHMNAFKKGMNEQMKKYMRFMIGQFKKTHKIYLKKLIEVTSIEQQLSHFLAPTDQ